MLTNNMHTLNYLTSFTIFEENSVIQLVGIKTFYFLLLSCSLFQLENQLSDWKHAWKDRKICECLMYKPMKRYQKKWWWRIDHWHWHGKTGYGCLFPLTIPYSLSSFTVYADSTWYSLIHPKKQPQIPYWYCRLVECHQPFSNVLQGKNSKPTHWNFFFFDPSISFLIFTG